MKSKARESKKLYEITLKKKKKKAEGSEMEKKSSLHDFRYTVPLLTVLVFFIFRFQQTKCLLIDIYFIQVWLRARVYIPVLGSVRESWCGPMTVIRLGLN